MCTNFCLTWLILILCNFSILLDRTGGHAYKLYTKITKYCRVNVRKHFVPNQVFAIWNEMDAAATLHVTRYCG